MATLFPNARDTANLIDPAGAVKLDATTPTHSVLHSTVSDALLAVEGVLLGPLVYNARGYGAKGDTLFVTDATTTSGSATIGSVAAGFGTADAGKQIVVVNPTSKAVVASGVIASTGTNTATMTSGTASATISGGTLQWGTDDTAAIQAAISAAQASGAGTVFFPCGQYMISPQGGVYGLNLPASNISLTALARMPATLVAKSGSTFNNPSTTANMQGQFITCTTPYQQKYNDLIGLVIDFNCQNAVSYPVGSTFICLSARSTIEKCELRHRGVANTFGVTFIAPDMVLRDSWIHDDEIWQTTTTAAGLSTAGAQSVTLANATGFSSRVAGATEGQIIVLDPSVNAIIRLSGTGAQTVTPRIGGVFAGRDDPAPNGMVASGMLGIRSGQSLVIGSGSVAGVTVTAGTYTVAPTVAFSAPTGANARQAVGTVALSGSTPVVTMTDGGWGYTAAPTVTFSGGTFTVAGTGTATMLDLQETVTVSAPTNTTFTATFSASLTFPHPLNTDIPVYYAGTPELVELSTISGTTLTFTTQIAHPTTGIALWTHPFVSDFCAIGTWQPGTQPQHGSKVLSNTADRIAIDLAGTSSGDQIIFAWNTITAPSGLTFTNGNGCVLTHNVVDATYYGCEPTGAETQYSGYWWVSAGYANTHFSNHVYSNNTFRGSARGFFIYGQNGCVLDNFVVEGNTIDTPWMNGMVLINSQFGAIKGNTIKNINQLGASKGAIGSDPFSGTAPAALFMLGSASNLICDSHTVVGNTFADNRVTHMMGYAVLGEGAWCTNNTAPAAANTIWGCANSPAIYPASGSVLINPGELYNATAAATAIAASTTEANYSTTYSVAGGFLRAGQVIRVTAQGIYTTSGTPVTLNFKVKLGTLIVAQTAAFTPTISLTNQGWRLEAQVVVLATGASGTAQMEAQGRMSLGTSATASQVINMTNAAALTSGFDTTVANTLAISVTSGGTTAGNTTQLRQLIVESLN